MSNAGNIRDGINILPGKMTCGVVWNTYSTIVRKNICPLTLTGIRRDETGYFMLSKGGWKNPDDPSHKKRK
jgi:hypothetical protein